MGLVVVTGVGPRTGTSFVMQQAKKNNMPVYGTKFIQNLTVEEHNPEGYYECLDPFAVPDGHIVKLWGHHINKLGVDKISRLVILERQNKKEQMQSIEKVLKDEMVFHPSVSLTPEDAFVNCVFDMTEWASKISPSRCMHVYTEDLNKEISNILTFMKGGF